MIRNLGFRAGFIKVMAKSPDQILEIMETLANDYDTARRVLDQYQPLYEILHDDCLTNIQAQKFDEFENPTVRDALSLAMISKLTKEEKAAFVRAENPALVDRVKRAEGVMRRIEKEFDMWSSQLIYHQSARKHEIAVGNYRP